ncbi:MAG TPA: DUF2238 domain-containing protein, partial [Gemmatimonadales bacterium]|nr:DUF2238 domain-containing protein [Gemmatimonadales bacterium]
MLSTATTHNRTGFGRNRLLQALVAWYAVIWVVTAIHPVYPADWLLENILALIAITGLVATYRIFRLSDLSYLLITAFMTLHAVGAHYTYAEVPLGEWMQSAFSLSRNHYDRLVHFSFGLLLAYPVREVFLRVASTRGIWAYYLPLDVTLAFSALYEIVEWLVAAMVAPQAGDAYLGTQGDIWDAQKDMLAAGIGALLCMSITVIVRRQRGQRAVLLAGESR